jgi:2-hydroxy-6-oxonona-2,4-dienedioate hydrolase
MGDVTTSLGRLHYERTGTPGEIGPIVLLHGMGMSTTSYDDVRDRLAAETEVISFDFPGHGKSDPAREELSCEQLADAIAEAADQLGLGAVNLIGNSLGAMTGVEFAATYPDRVRRLVLVGCPGWDGRWRMERLKVSREMWSSAADNPATVESLAPMFTSPTPALVDRVNESRKQSRPSIAHAGMAVYTHDTLGRSFAVQAPTLLLVGERDIVVPDQPKFQRAIPNVSMVTFENAGHYPQVDHPERFAETVLEFFRA